MAINDIVQTIAEARVDARSLSEFVFKPAGFKVTRRLAPPIDTLQFYIDKLDTTVATIPNIVNEAINNTAVEGGVLADTFVTATAKTGGVARTQRDKNSDVVSVKDFGAKGDGVTDDTAAFFAAIEYGNTQLQGTTIFIPTGVYVIRTSLPPITTPISWKGQSRRNTILEFKHANGFSFELLDYYSAYTACIISDLYLTTNANGLYTAIKYTGASAIGSRDQSLIIERCGISSERAIKKGDISGRNEWLLCVHLVGTQQAVIRDCHLRGADFRVSGNHVLLPDYDTDTKSYGIYLENSTAIRMISVVFIYFHTAIKAIGQTEGIHIDLCSAAAVDNGVVFDELISPCNNHYITDSHFACSLVGLAIEAGTNRPPIANYISNCFFLERLSTVDKPKYTALRLYVEKSNINTVTVQSNTTFTPDVTALEILNANNIVDNFTVHNATNLFDVKFNGNNLDLVQASNIVQTGIVGTKIANGKALILIDDTDGLGGKLHRAFKHTFHTIADKQILQMREDNLRLGDTGAFEIYMRGGAYTSAFDARILCSGGSSSTNGQGMLAITSDALTVNNKLLPSLDDSAILGSSGKRWQNIYAATSVISTSDVDLKTTFLDVQESEISAAIKIKKIIGKYKFKSAIDSKGDDARYHFGVGAQIVGQIMRDEGLDPAEYGFYCYDEWGATDEVRDTYGNIISEAVSAGSRYGIRYDELIMFILAAI